MKKYAIFNRCPEPDCMEETLWMPHEDRCGKCGYGGTPKHTNIETKNRQANRDVSRAAALVVGAIVVFVIGFAAGYIFSAIGLV